MKPLLFALTIFAHIADAKSSIGHNELNPLMKWIVARPERCYPIKSSIAVGQFLALENFRKRHKYWGLALHVGLNGAIIGIAIRNYKIGRK